MKGKAEFKFTLESGEEIGFRFGTLAASYTEEISGKSIYGVFHMIAPGPYQEYVKTVTKMLAGFLDKAKESGDEKSQAEIIAAIGAMNVAGSVATKGSTMAMLFYFYGGMRAYNDFKGVDKRITIPMVSEIVDELGEETMNKMYVESLKIYTGDKKKEEKAEQPGEPVAA